MKFLIFILAPICAGLIAAKVMHQFIPIFFYVCFFSSIFTLLLSIFLAGCYSFYRKDSKSMIEENSILYSLISSLIIFSFLATVPLNLDRSFSVWMLNQNIESERSLSIQELEVNASEFFSPSGGEIRRRIKEQISLGNLIVIQDKVELTDRGKFTWKMNRLISDFFGLNKKYTG
jgi:hypothetical protein